MVTIAIDGLSADIGRRSVLTDISATLRPGRLIGIIGPNGAGKSTLARCLLGLVPAREGSVTLGDRDVRAIAARELASMIAYLPQGQTLHWPLSVERLVALGRLPHLGPMSRLSAQDHAIVREAMTRADVNHLAGRTATELSGGERARVMLARALAVGAPAIVADEPLASLDPGHQLDVMALLTGEARTGSLVIAVLHDLTMAARFCDEILLMHQGQLVTHGSPEHVLTAQRLEHVYRIKAQVDLRADHAMILPLRRT
jgi:iron complex transport system ATP-binding protein